MDNLGGKSVASMKSSHVYYLGLWRHLPQKIQNDTPQKHSNTLIKQSRYKYVEDKWTTWEKAKFLCI